LDLLNAQFPRLQEHLKNYLEMSSNVFADGQINYQYICLTHQVQPKARELDW